MLKCLFAQIYNFPTITQIFMPHWNFQKSLKVLKKIFTVFQRVREREVPKAP